MIIIHFFPDDLWRRMVRLPVVGHRAYGRFGMLILILGQLSAYRSAERTSARFYLPLGLELPFVAFVTLTPHERKTSRQVIAPVVLRP